MRQLGLPVPPALVLTTEICREYHAADGTLPADAWTASAEGIKLLEHETRRSFGGGPHPLLVSVRSGAAVSMPGMMDTILNLGIDDEVERALADESGSPAYARNTHRRFCQQYARTVLRVPIRTEDRELSPDEFRRLIVEEWGKEIPTDPYEQLRGAIEAVFRSWESRRARSYRKHWNIPNNLGTAVTIQAMVFGNLDERSGTGVLFTRNPLTGEDEPYGEYLPGGQGEDVVSGEVNPRTLAELADQLPDVHAELVHAGRVLERTTGDVQDVEFTVERGRLYLLQTRAAKRSPQAAVRVAIDLVGEGVIEPDQALRHVTAPQIRSLLRPHLSDTVRREAVRLASGEPACPGVTSGRVVVRSDDAEAAAASGESVVLARPKTSPDDVQGMIAAQAVITERGGATSHAAVVSRSLGRPCVVGCGEGALMRLRGSLVTVDGATGQVFEGVLITERTYVSDDPSLRQLHEWARTYSPIRVYRPNDDVPGDTIDLDAAGVDDPKTVAEAVVGSAGARGRVLETDEGIHAAMAAGLHHVIVDEPLPALIAAIRWERGEQA